MPRRKPTLSDFQSETIGYLQQNTAFSNFFSGSTIKSITDIVNLQMSDLSNHVHELSNNSFLDTASGYYLDLIGGLFNVHRSSAVTYETDAAEKNIKFYTKRLITLKQALGTNIIPKGTSIQTVDGKVKLALSQDALFNDTDTFVFASAVQTTQESSFVAGPNTVVVHSLNNSDVFVTNNSQVSYNSASEPDSIFRSRIASAIFSMSGPNETSIVSALKSFPDVAQIDLRPGVSGSGSYDVYLIPQGNRISQATLRGATQLLYSLSGFGIAFNVREYDYIPIKMEVLTRTSPSMLNSQKQGTFIAAENAIQGLIGNLFPGDSLSMSQIISAVMSADNRIYAAEVVYLCVNKKVVAITDLSLNDDELFVPDPDEVNPIMVRQ